MCEKVQRGVAHWRQSSAGMAIASPEEGKEIWKEKFLGKIRPGSHPRKSAYGWKAQKATGAMLMVPQQNGGTNDAFHQQHPDHFRPSLSN